MIITNLQIYYLKNSNLMRKLTAKVVLKENVCPIMKKMMQMILDTNLKLIKDGNILAFYIQNGTMDLY